ncbi:unnamed protein product, partial [Lymnaea stagnalis]
MGRTEVKSCAKAPEKDRELASVDKSVQSGVVDAVVNSKKKGLDNSKSKIVSLPCQDLTNSNEKLCQSLQVSGEDSISSEPANRGHQEPGQQSQEKDCNPGGDAHARSAEAAETTPSIKHVDVMSASASMSSRHDNSVATEISMGDKAEGFVIAGESSDSPSNPTSPPRTPLPAPSGQQVPTAATVSPGSKYKESLQKVIETCKAKLGIDSIGSDVEDGAHLVNPEDEDGLIDDDDDDDDSIASDALLMDIAEEGDAVKLPSKPSAPANTLESTTTTPPHNVDGETLMTVSTDRTDDNLTTTKSLPCMGQNPAVGNEPVNTTLKKSSDLPERTSIPEKVLSVEGRSISVLGYDSQNSGEIMTHGSDKNNLPTDGKNPPSSNNYDKSKV